MSNMIVVYNTGWLYFTKQMLPLSAVRVKCHLSSA